MLEFSGLDGGSCGEALRKTFRYTRHEQMIVNGFCEDSLNVGARYHGMTERVSWQVS